MGTLFQQQDRLERLRVLRIVNIGSDIKAIAEELEISFDEAPRLFELVAKIDDYNSTDEQLAGFGKLLKDLSDVLDNNEQALFYFGKGTLKW